MFQTLTCRSRYVLRMTRTPANFAALGRGMLIGHERSVETDTQIADNPLLRHQGHQKIFLAESTGACSS
ncbi:hypothetical protein [Paraburkholderia tropica]|uniref:hypothetical protein n=1 Tax=Paraburkholderia tropica TaxID=92647 RepID=UPI0012E9E9A1|nr:hypothetical protein [Paraburkholderia tropica]